MAPAAYAEVKTAMQAELNQYEEDMAKGAVPPLEMSRVKKAALDEPNATSLASGARMARPTGRAVIPPAQFLHPPTAAV